MKNKNIFYGVIISYINVIISIAYGFLSVPILLEALGKSEYGVYSTIASLIGYMSIMDFGIHNVLVRYLTKYRVQKDRAAYENLLAISFVIYSVIAAFLLLAGIVIYKKIDLMFADSFSKAEIVIAKRIYWVVMTDLIISLPGAVFQCVINAEEHFIFGRTVLGLKQIIKLILVAAVTKIGGRSFALVCAVFALNVTVIVCQAVYAFGKVKIKIKLHEWKWGYICSLFSYTAFVFIASVADQILWKLDSVILGIRISAEVVAIYAVAMNLVTIFRKFSGAVSGIFLPRATVMSITDRSSEASVRLMTKVGVMQFLILSLALIGFFIVGQEFLDVWLGTGYEDVYVIFVILAVSLLVPSCQSIGINILEARNKHRFRAVVFCLLALANGLLTYIVVSTHGIIGAAVCTGLTVVIGQVVIINIYYAKVLHLNIIKFFINTFAKFLIPVAAAGLTAYAISARVPLYGSWKSLIIKSAIIISTYTVIIILLGGKNIRSVYKNANKEK